MKNVFLLLIVFFISGCGLLRSAKFKELGSTEIDRNTSKFSIDIPEKWFSYYEYHHVLAYAPIEFKQDIEQQKFDVFYTIYSRPSDGDTLKEYLDSYLKKMFNNYNNFRFKIIEGEHETYGKYYVVKYRLEDKLGLGRTVISALIVRGDVKYRFYYMASDKYFEKYLSEVVKTINTFKIKE